MEEDYEEGPRGFAVLVQQLSDGDCHAEASLALHKLGKALLREAHAQRRPVKGELTLKLSLACDARGVVSVAYDVKRKEPAPARPTATLWLTDQGNLSVDNPRQTKLGLREVSRRGPAREVDGADGAKEV